MPKKLFDCTRADLLSFPLHPHSLFLSLPSSLSCHLHFHLLFPALISLFFAALSLFSPLPRRCGAFCLQLLPFALHFVRSASLGSCCQLPFAIWRCILLCARLIAVTTTKLQTHTKPMPKCVKRKATDSLALVTLLPLSLFSLSLSPLPFPLTAVRHMQRNCSTTICC